MESFFYATNFGNNAPMLPSYLNVAEIKNDLTLYEQLDELEMLALQLVDKNTGHPYALW